MSELDEQIGALEKQFKVFTIRGADGIGVHGSMKHGFVVSGEGGGGGGGGGGGTGEATGACCLPDNSCVVSTAAACGDAGGIYQGDGFPCDPNPCAPATGSCCSVVGQLDPKTWHVTCAVTTEEGCVGIFFAGDPVCSGTCPQLLLLTDSSAAATEIADPCLFRPFLSGDTFLYVSYHTDCDDPTHIFDTLAPTNGPTFQDACYYYGYRTETIVTTGCQSGRVCTETISYQNPFDEALWTSEAGGAIARLTCPLVGDPGFSGVCGDCSVVDPGNPACIDDTSATQVFTLSDPVIWDDVFAELFSHLPALLGTWASGASTDAAHFGGSGICGAAAITQMQYKWAIDTAQAFDVTVDWDEDTQVFSVDELTLVSESPVHFSEVIPAGFTETSVHFIGVPPPHTSVELINPVIHT